MAAKLRWQATCGNEPVWDACQAGLRRWWSPARGCFASLAATVPLSRILRAGSRPKVPLRLDLDAVQMNADAAAHMGIADGEVVELVSDLGRDRVRVETTPYLHPACIFTSAAPGGRSFGADAGGAQALGVGPLDHTPLRWDPLTGAALTQENAVRVEKIAAREDNNE